MARSNRASAPEFWRDERLPFVEVRSVSAGQGICYGKHFHETVAIGTIVEGACIYSRGSHQHELVAGDLVVVNPGEVHACAQTGEQPLSYLMLYVDADFVATQQGEDEEATAPGDFRPFATTITGALFAEFTSLHQSLLDPEQELLAKECSLHAFLMQLHATLASRPADRRDTPRGLALAADFMGEHFRDSMKLADIAAASGLSVPHLIRSFGRHFGMSPHQYLTHRRIQFAQDQLRGGRPIAAVAAEAGFADQAHLQRAFKAQVAATPGQYLRARSRS